MVVNLKRENEILKRLLKDGYFYMNYDSIDCDGCSVSSVRRFESLEELYEAEEREAEWTDGSFCYSIPTRYPDGSLELNEEYRGGQWE
jgi:hypothetical protein